MNTSKTRGFTLIELLVVIAIIGMLSSVILASLSSARSKSRDARRLSDVKQLQTALELYYASNNSYPISSWTYSTGWSTAFQTAMAPYMPTLPADPINQGAEPRAGDLVYGYFATGYGGSGKWYMIVFNLENPSASLEAQDGVTTCNGQVFDYSALTFGMSC